MTIRAFENRLPAIGKDTYVDESALIVGDVAMGDDCSVWPMAVIRGDVNKIRIGHRTNVQDGSVLHVTHPHEARPQGFGLQLGNNVTVGHKVILHGCTVGDDCLIGMGAIIMDGAIVHPYTLIGAGALVSPGKELEGGYLWLGAPARKARPLSAQERQWIDYSARHYMELKNRYLNK